MPQAGYPAPSRASKSPKAGSVFYAVVLHDFQAERTDELDAKSGDAISVVAHSNREWFVAKPIGKLGGPGLIPASFIEVRDPLTGQPVDDVDGLIDRGELPPVEEWKKATMNYKASSIALGVIDSPSAGPVPNSKFQQMALNSPGAEQRYTYGSAAPNMGYQQEGRADLDGPLEPPEPDMSRLDVAEPLPYGTLIRAEVSSFHQENGEWLFRVNATFRPDPPVKPNPFDPTPTMSRELTLFRVYDDFYVFQIHLLRAFPVEAGRDPDRPDEVLEDDEDGSSTRILPFMPGPLYDVDETVTESRRHDLDVYLKELVALREVGAENILRCELVRKFFAAREGDIENEVPLPDQDDFAVESRGSHYDDTPYTTQSQQPRQTSDYQTSYNYGGGRTSSTAETSQYPKKPSAHPYAEAAPARRQGSSGSGENNGYPRASTASNDRYGQDDGGRYQSGYSGRLGDHGVISPALKFNSSSYGSPKRRNGSPQRSPYGQSSVAPGRDRDSDYRGHSVTPSTSNTNVTRSSQGNPNSPRISQSNPNAAFVKIKIFHSSTDELIAIRVSPRVSLRQLMEKVRERLGDDVENVKYRDGMASGGAGGTGQFMDILDDVELREWMGSGDKLVLYAE
jgi:bud emergence protein 1